MNKLLLESEYQSMNPLYLIQKAMNIRLTISRLKTRKQEKLFAVLLSITVTAPGRHCMMSGRKWYSLYEVYVLMSWPAILSLVFSLTTLLIRPSYAEKLTLGDESVIVWFDSPLQNSAREVLKIYPALRVELMTDLGWRTAFRPEIVLIKDSASFRSVADSDLVTALAIPQKNLILIDSSKINYRPFSLGTTLKHELCHLELHHHIAESNLPRWFDEGICQWVSGGLSEIITESNHSILREAVLSNRLISIEELAEKFPADGRDLLLAYDESRSIVEYIAKQFGASGVRRILEQMSRGDNLENAVSKTTLISLNELEKRWKSSLSEQASWFSYIGSNLYEILFLFAALISIYGFFVVLKKKREYKDEEDLDDE